MTAWIYLLVLLKYALCKPPPYTGNKINIHIMAHTHDDTGWVYTTDEYYIHIVQWIFYTLIPTLENDPDHKFTYVEMAFFQRWWSEQNDSMKQRVLKLLNNRQLQINLGGWCMNDEANPNAASEIRQMMDGAQFILYNFGQNSYPNTGWHIDPFGSSYVTAGMWGQIGFDTFGINRISYKDKDQRKKDKRLEFMWKGSNSLGEESWIWTHIMDSYYCTPNEIYFNGLDGRWYEQNEKWIVTNDKLPSYPTNYIQMAQQFVTDARNRNSWYRHNHILIPFGCDFAHFNAYMSYIQMDKLINYINSNSTYNASIFYSTLYDYTVAINALNLTWDLEQNTDFFVYQSAAHQWWSGYFTSRPDLKSYVRSRENYLRTAELLYVFAINLNNIIFNADNAMINITKLRRAVDVTQHHDAITGTERDHVYIEYMVQMETGTQDTAYFMNNIVVQLLAKKQPVNYVPLLFNTVETIQKLTTSNMAPLVLFNSLSWNVTQLISIGTNRTDIVIYDENGNLILSQINPIANGSKPFENEPAKYSLYFIANNLLPLSFTTYFIKQTNNEPVYLGKISESNKIGNDSFYTLMFDNDNGKLSQITNNILGKTFSVNNNFFHYGSTGVLLNDNLPQDDNYKFRPAQDNRYQMLAGKKMMQVTLPFRQFTNFSSLSIVNPGFIIASHIGIIDFKNNYIAHICDIDINNTQFTFQFYGTIPGESWPKSNYYTDWIVFGNDYESVYLQHLLDNKNYGFQLVNKASAAKMNVTIDLTKYAFTTTPFILTSIRKVSCNDNISKYTTNVVLLSNTKAIVQISRVDSSSAWVDKVYIDFIVWENTKSNDNKLSNEGIYPAVISSDIKHSVINISFNSDFIVNEPIVLTQIMQTKSAQSGTTYDFVITAVNNNRINVSLSIELLNPSTNAKKENINLNIISWSFERVTMKENITSTATNIIYSGPLLDEIHQYFRTNYSQTYRVVNTMKYGNDLRYIENNVILDWIDNRTNFISHFDMTDMVNNYTLFTAQNSLEYIERKYDPLCDERVACNFFPTSSQSYLQNINDNTIFSSIIDQAHAVGIMHNGDHQLLLQRRCAGIDNDPWNGDLFQHGCLSPSNHSEPIIYLLYDDSDMVSYLNRRLYVLQQYKPLVFTNVYNSNDINKYKTEFNTKWSAINESSKYYPM
eukprot:481054_1